MGIEPFIGEISMFAGNFAPRGWAFCDGQLLPISMYSALFSILGTTYGGDGETTFALPDLRGRVPMHAGSGPGLTPRQLGQRAGAERVQLTVNQIPAHSHAATTSATAKAFATEGDSTAPGEKTWAKSGQGDPDYATPNGSSVDMADGAISANTSVANAGGNQTHENMQPFLAVNYIIALVGVFPSED